MNTIDALIILLALGSLLRGYRIGLLRQAGSTIGFALGLLVGSWIASLIIAHEHNSVNKSLTSLTSALIVSFAFMTVGEIVGLRLKQKLILHRESLDKFDRAFGSVMSLATIVLAAWLAAAILVLGPPGSVQQSIKNSRIIAALNNNLPPATRVLSSINKLIDPNGFPQVFRGLEPSPTTTTLPSPGTLQKAIQSDRASVVKVEGTGCGGIVEGSGFVIAADKIATNAHVVAGVDSPKVIDENGIHNTRVVWFDKNIDLAVLQVSNLAGKPLSLVTAEQANNTPAAVLGFPGGGNFDAEPAAIIEHFTAYGRNIYGENTTARDIYSVQANVIPGNSGGPLVGIDGKVLGIVFATSSSYNNVGYALTGHQVAGELLAAQHSTQTYNTGSCSE